MNNNIYDNLKSSLNRFNNNSIKMKRTPSSDTFDKLMMKITNKEIIKNVKSMINCFNDVHKLVDENHNMHSLSSNNSARIFLTCFMILNFNDDVVSTIEVVEKELIKQAEKTLESFEHFRQLHLDQHMDHKLISDFVNNFHIMYEMFNSWRTKDADKLVEILSRSYNQLCETEKIVISQLNGNKSDDSSDENKGLDIWLSELEKQKNQIIEQIIKIGGEDSVKKLDNFKVESVNVLNNTDMMAIAKKAYWDRFKEMLSQEQPDRSMLYVLLKEIKERLNKFTPRRDDLLQENNGLIDVEYIKRQIEGDVFSGEQFVGLSNFIIGRILMFESPSENESTKKWQTSMTTLFTQPGSKYSDILPKLLKGICEKLDKIEADYKRFTDVCKKTSCDKCGAQNIEAFIPNYMGRPSMPRCPTCRKSLMEGF